MNILEIKNLSLKILDKKILKNINFELKEKEIISIIGKSGSGKTMLSKMIMGLKNKKMEIFYLKTIIFLIFQKKI